MLVPLEATPHSLRNPTSVNHASRRSILTFSFQGNDKYAGACRQKKTRGRQSLALPDASHIQKIAHRDHAPLHRREVAPQILHTHGCTEEKLHGGERERRCKRIRLQYFPVFHRSLTKMTDGGERGRCSFCTLSGRLQCIGLSIVRLPRPW